MLVLTSAAMAHAPLLPKQGKALENLVPKGWSVVKKAMGDLNGDGVSDLAFVIQGSDAQYIKGKQSDNDGVINLNPRVLAIYFQNEETGQYHIKRQLNSFIPLLDDHGMDEPLSEFVISKTELRIGFHFWSTSGRDTADYLYSFSYRQKSFQLLAFFLSRSNRSSGNTIDHHFNFGNKKLTVTKGNFAKDDPTSFEQKKFHLKNPKTLRSFKKPFAWKFMGVGI